MSKTINRIVVTVLAVFICLCVPMAALAAGADDMKKGADMMMKGSDMMMSGAEMMMMDGEKTMKK
jgi:hypothetical protein